jgi:O-antigen/teichoic acid export membrane protein
METPAVFVLLLLTAISSFVVQSLAVYLRSFKREPYLIQSMTVASLTIVGVLLAVPRWGGEAAAAIYFLVSGVLGLIWALAIFRQDRNARSSKTGPLSFPRADPSAALNCSPRCP